MPNKARPRAIDKIAWSAASLATAALALFVAVHHPLWPWALATAMGVWAVFAYRFSRAWLVALPALLPALNFSPWTGWIGIEEIDLAILTTVAAGYARFARDATSRPPPMPLAGRAITLGLVGLTVLALCRGVADAGGWYLDWFQGYTEPLNSLRLGKSSLHALLLLPLMRHACAVGHEQAFRRFACGMVVGAAVVTAAVLWERAAFPGFLNVMSPYRTVGAFWEMHVGGAAIDAYVVLCTPFVAWSLWAAQGRWQWTAAALFAPLWAYACLTTFSRGAYLGIAVGMLVLGLHLPPAPAPRWWLAARAVASVIGAALLLALVLDGWGYGAAALALLALGAAFWLRWRGHAARRHRGLAAGLLALVLIFEAVVMLGPDSFMSSRMARSAQDYESRTAHWRRGLDLLQGSEDWLFGLGLGRLPAHYDRDAPRGEFSGSAQWRQDDDGAQYARIAGPRSRPALAGRHGLTQRVALQATYRMRLDLRAKAPVNVLVRVCESHLLYDRNCQAALLRLATSASSSEWQQRQVTLAGPPLRQGRWFAPRLGVLTVSVLGTDSHVDIDNLVLGPAEGVEQLLFNATFSSGLAGWLPAAQTYFVPWHIDNLYLELLIERGIVGATALLVLTGGVLLRLLRSPEQGGSSSAFVAASLCAVLSVGLVSSVLDVPRIALLLGLLLMLCSLRVK